MRSIDRKFRLVITGRDSSPTLSTVECIIKDGDIKERPTRTATKADFSDTLENLWQEALAETREREGLDEE
jgi:hypothetical protein